MYPGKGGVLTFLGPRTYGIQRFYTNLTHCLFLSNEVMCLTYSRLYVGSLPQFRHVFNSPC